MFNKNPACMKNLICWIPSLKSEYFKFCVHCRCKSNKIWNCERLSCCRSMICFFELSARHRLRVRAIFIFITTQILAGHFFGPRNLSIACDQLFQTVFKKISRAILWRAVQQIFSLFSFYMRLERVIQKARSALNLKRSTFFTSIHFV